MSHIESQQPIQMQDDDVSLAEVLRPLWNRRWVIIFCTLLVTLAVAIYVSLLKPTYQATAILLIGNNKPANTLSINNAFNESSATAEQIQTQYELLRSRKFAERVIARLNLTENEEFSGQKYKKLLPWQNEKKLTQKRSIDYVVKAFQQRLTISPMAKTELVRISFSAYDPVLAMRVANQVGVTYLQYQDEIHTASKETTSQWLVDQLEELGKKLEASEHALQQFRESESIVDIHGVVGLVSAELTELTSAAIRAARREDDLKVTYDYIQKNKNNLQELIELPEVSHDDLYIGLKGQEEIVNRKHSELSKRYGPKHPKMIAINAEIASLEKRIAEHTDNVVLALTKDYFAAKEKAVATNARLTAAKQDFLRLSRLENKFSQLEREVETNKELYSNYLVRLKEADAMGNYKTNFYVRFIDKAVVPKSPYKPNKILALIVAVVLSVIFISIIIIMRELLIDTLNSRRKLDNFHEAPVLAILPKFKLDKSAQQRNKYYQDNRFVEAVRSLRTALLFRQDKAPPKIIAITSSVPNEGKSTVALELARSFSEMEKVLLIEGDMRHPTIAKSLKLEPNRPGLSNLLAKTHEINECIVRDDHVKLDILTSGITPSNPLAFLSMKRFGMLIKVFGNFYDRIIIETPPVNAVSDAVIISRNVDSVIYIVHGGKTKRDEISAGLRTLKQVSAPIDGVVINRSENIDTTKYHNKYYNNPANIIKLPVRRQA
ncbi:polysaccharide biosynthesis tyrosine autokinase [Thalassotalea sp. LPB0316]|uniref:GumC family protein n=1 Tax=Thalassotalea sp. LPB0316 TaxID=2769490 RepID=UPI001868BAA5|nr:polysaccharide biosynthesis tyrosine autokinase [Thalassotalea sp. LPB0316]QOL26153.1 polysaccharide biosynthesis tyrosine autokinase [Thalassotalea sp. LPB0316]